MAHTFTRDVRNFPTIAHKPAKNVQARLPTTHKIKGLQVMAGPYGTTTPIASFSTNWTSFVKPQMDACVGLGANSIKTGVLALEVINGAVSLATWQTQMNTWLGYCRTLGVTTYMLLCNGFDLAATASAAQNATALSTYVSMAAWLDANYSDVIVGFDCALEANTNWGKAPTLAHMQVLRPALLKVTDIPLSAGISCGNINQAFADDNGTATLAPYCDFMDFHAYWGAGSLTPQNVIDWWRTQTYYKPWMIGECGRAWNAVTDDPPTRWQHLGELSQMKDCFGVYGYNVWDWEPSPNNYGIYASDGSGAARSTATQFANWATRF